MITSADDEWKQAACPTYVCNLDTGYLSSKLPPAVYVVSGCIRPLIMCVCGLYNGTVSVDIVLFSEYVHFAIRN